MDSKVSSSRSRYVFALFFAFALLTFAAAFWISIKNQGSAPPVNINKNPVAIDTAQEVQEAHPHDDQPPRANLVINPNAQAPRTMQDFIQQVKNLQHSTEHIFSQATAAPFDAQGVVLLSGGDGHALTIPASYIEDGNNPLKLLYAGITKDMEAPIVYLVNEALGQIEVKVTPDVDSLLLETSNIDSSSDNYIVHIMHYNPLQRQRTRYLFTLTDEP